MKTASGALITLLNSNTQFFVADLYEFALKDTTVLRYTSADIDLTYAGNVYSSRGPKITRGKTRVVVGIQVDTLDLTVYSDATHLVGAQSFAKAINSGVFDGCDFTLRRAFMPTWGDTSVGSIIMFMGQFSEVVFGRFETKIRIKSDLQMLDLNMPRVVYQASCSNTLFDPACAVVKASFKSVTATTSGSTKSQLNCGLAQASAYFDNGTILFTTGANTGVARTVKSYTPGVVQLIYALPLTPGVGDAFDIYPGCDKVYDTCRDKFSNQLNFRGFPFVPLPEVSY